MCSLSKAEIEFNWNLSLLFVDKKTHNAVGNGNVLQYETEEAASAAEAAPQVEKAPKGE